MKTDAGTYDNSKLDWHATIGKKDDILKIIRTVDDKSISWVIYNNSNGSSVVLNP